MTGLAHRRLAEAGARDVAFGDQCIECDQKVEIHGCQFLRGHASHKRKSFLPSGFAAVKASSPVWLMRLPDNRISCRRRMHRLEAVMLRSDPIHNAVQHIHEAPLTRDGWNNAVSAIASVTDSQHAFFFVFDPVSRSTDLAFHHGSAAEHTAAFVAAGATRRWPAWAYTLPVGRVVQTSAMQPDREFARSTFYNEAVRPLGAFYGLALSPLRTPRRQVYVTAGRHLGRDDYAAMDEAAALQTLVPHIETALRVSQRLAAADLRARSVATALDRLGIGVILVDAAATVLFANRIADSLLAGNQGLRLGQDDLGVSDPPSLRTLHRLIAACAKGGSLRVGGSPGGSVNLTRGPGRLPLRVLVAPVQWPQRAFDLGWAPASHPVALLLVTDLEQQHLLRRDQLRQRFDLTPAEADVALELVKGDGRQAAAGRLDLSPATVSTHLQRIFEKTGTRRQAELVNLILRSVPSH